MSETSSRDNLLAFENAAKKKFGHAQRMAHQLGFHIENSGKEVIGGRRYYLMDEKGRFVFPLTSNQSATMDEVLDFLDEEAKKQLTQLP